MTKTRTSSPTPLKPLYDGANVAPGGQTAPKSLYAKPPANGKPPKESKKGQKSQCGTCTHGKRFHRESPEVTYHPKRVLAGAGRCRVGAGGVAPCTCEAFLAAPAGVERYPSTLGYGLHPDDYAYVKRFRAEDDSKTRLSVDEILVLIGPHRDFYLTAEGRFGKTPARGPRAIYPDADLEWHYEQPSSFENRATVLQHYGHHDREKPASKPRLSSIDIGSALAIYRKIVAGSKAEAMYGPDDGRTLAAYGALYDDCSGTTNRAEFERVRAVLNGNAELTEPFHEETRS